MKKSDFFPGHLIVVATLFLISCGVADPSDDDTDDNIPLDGCGEGIIAFYSERDENAEIYAMNADGSNQLRLPDHQCNDYYPGWAQN